MKKGRKAAVYYSELPSLMYRYFIGYEDGSGAPSFEKFARSIGVTVLDIESWRKNKRFERAYRECNEIRRDYLIDHALTRRFDPSFVKFLLDTEAGSSETSEGDMTVKIEVIE